MARQLPSLLLASHEFVWGAKTQSTPHSILFLTSIHGVECCSLKQQWSYPLFLPTKTTYTREIMWSTVRNFRWMVVDSTLGYKSGTKPMEVSVHFLRWEHVEANRNWQSCIAINPISYCCEQRWQWIHLCHVLNVTVKTLNSDLCCVYILGNLLPSRRALRML